MNYEVTWIDCAGNKHIKQYISVSWAIKKTFAVYSWYKNGSCTRLSDGTKIL